MKSAANRSYRLIIIVIAVIGILTGCSSVFQRLDDNMHRKRFTSDYEALERAIAVYDRGDVELAQGLFKELASSSASDIYSRKARLGLICSRLILADTQADYTQAIGMWHQFEETAVGSDAWDLRLLDPLVVRMTPKTNTRVVYVHPPAEQQPTSKHPQPYQPSSRTQVQQEELERLKKKASLATQLQDQIDQIVAENQSLREKIKALEAIDQSIQKKKTEISAPSE